jgi:hypothetical protein
MRLRETSPCAMNYSLLWRKSTRDSNRLLRGYSTRKAARGKSLPRPPVMISVRERPIYGRSAVFVRWLFEWPGRRTSTEYFPGPQARIN